MPKIIITDDGDETVIFRDADGKLLFLADHEDYGWHGLRGFIEKIETLAAAFGIEIDNRQDIV